jgi:hypothetical protein
VPPANGVGAFDEFPFIAVENAVSVRVQSGTKMKNSGSSEKAYC